MRELWAYDEPHFSGGNCQVTMTREQAIAMQRRQYPYETDEAAFDDWQSVNWAYPVSDTSSRATVTAKPFTPDWSLLRATQASLREHMAALKAAQEPERAFREQVAAALRELRARIAAESVSLTPENAAGYSRDIADAENATVELALHHVDATIAALGLGGTEETR